MWKKSWYFQHCFYHNPSLWNIINKVYDKKVLTALNLYSTPQRRNKPAFSFWQIIDKQKWRLSIIKIWTISDRAVHLHQNEDQSYNPINGMCNMNSSRYDWWKWKWLTCFTFSYHFDGISKYLYLLQ